MSVSTENRPFTGRDGADEEDGVGGHSKEIEKNKGKKLSFFRFRKVKRKYFLRKRPKGVSENSGKRRGKGRCCLCMKEPGTSDSAGGGGGGDSQTSDPNSPTFTYEMLRVFIENNDFYSKECNPHVDVLQSIACSNHDEKVNIG